MDAGGRTQHAAHFVNAGRFRIQAGRSVGVHFNTHGIARFYVEPVGDLRRQPKVAIIQQGAAASKAALMNMFSQAQVSALAGSLRAGSNVTVNDKSTNTFNTGANAKDVQSLVDRRIVRNLQKVIRK